MNNRIVVLFFLIFIQLNCVLLEVYICTDDKGNSQAVENFISENELFINCSNYNTTFSPKYAMKTPSYHQYYFCDALYFPNQIQKGAKNSRLSYRVSITSLVVGGYFLENVVKFLFVYFKPMQSRLNVIVHLEVIDRDSLQVIYMKTKSYSWNVFLRPGVFSDHGFSEVVGNYLTSEIGSMLLETEKDLKQ
jgi:hypothetical protein